ncbi:MAG: dephospho-CoA kinase [Desulfomonile tiedjei]|uniref:Dephospho-CoA kinase n=1 Tax=Desulfomonile tiedjei TaxID=2358 RepID=A0A9D6V6J4_9BACT|nr:dephospho-CoA kinase [Desulfomonile tiedjei]
MLIVGLTGGIASGKSTVGRMFQECGIPLICADELARKAVEPGSDGLGEIRRVFGKGVLDAQGGLDRAAMARIVFQDPGARKLLESIVHPVVSKEKERILKNLECEGHEVVIVDVPLLYESSWEKGFDLIIVAYSPKAVQEQRLVVRDNMSKEEALARLDAQMDIEEKRRLADRVIDNTGDPAQTRRQVEGLLNELKTLAERKKSAEKMRSGLG